MNIRLSRYSIACALACLTLSIITTQVVVAGDAENFITKLKAHYAKAPQLKVFALNYHYLGGGDPYQAWDYQTPERYMSLRMVEIDLVNEHFVENDIHHFPDGKTFNRIEFQHDTDSFFYDKNGIGLGKGLLRQNMDSFQDKKGFVFMNIDFLAVTPLLEEDNIASTIKHEHDKLTGQTTLTHTISDDNIIDYTFSDNPLQLLSINNKSQQKKFLYGDYKTSNGITFARSIFKYYGDVTKPSFIHRIDQLHILDKIDHSRFEIPKGFGPVIPKSDKTLVSKNIAPNLYLVTDASAWRNTLFKVNGDEIMVFGGPLSTELAEETIQLILGQFPSKRITSVYVTHSHSDHIAGLRAYAKRGIEIHTDAYSIAAIKAYPQFSDDITTFKFRAIEHGQVIDGISFYVLESPHSKRQGFVHFKDSGIIYQANFLEVAFDNSIPNVVPNYTKIFIDFVRRKQLKFSRIVGHHYNNHISVDMMNKVYDANR